MGQARESQVSCTICTDGRTVHRTPYTVQTLGRLEHRRATLCAHLHKLDHTTWLLPKENETPLSALSS